MGASLGGGGSGRRRGSRRISRAPMSEINVTPFVDVMLVLLVIFMVTAPLLTSGVPLDLPETKSKQLTTGKDPLTISVNSKGEIFLQESKITLEEVGRKLKAINKGGLDEPIFVRGDRKIDYGIVIQVMARINEAGFQRVSLLTDSDG
ncbi:MAG: protein TolR [Hyphomicrobiaceae bacterium]